MTKYSTKGTDMMLSPTGQCNNVPRTSIWLTVCMQNDVHVGHT